MNQPKKWTEVYAYGTKAGDEEAKVFRALARHPKYDFRSVSAIVKETNLDRERVEEIIEKYAVKVNPPLIYQHPTNENHWGYWERCPEVLKKDDRGIGSKDKEDRIKKHLDNSCSASIAYGSMSNPIVGEVTLDQSSEAVVDATPQMKEESPVSKRLVLNDMYGDFSYLFEFTVSRDLSSNAAFYLINNQG